MNPEYYFQKGLRLIVASAVIFALIVLFSAMVSRGFPLWLALVLLVPAGLGVVGFYFFSVGSSADLSERFFVVLGVVSREAKRKQRQKESVPNSGVKEARTRSCRNPPLFLPIRFRTIGFSKMHSPPSTNIPIRIWAMPLTGRIGKFCDDVCFIWHVWRLFRMMCRRFGFGMIG